MALRTTSRPFKKAFEADNPNRDCLGARLHRRTAAKLMAEKDNPRADITGLAASNVGLMAAQNASPPTARRHDLKPLFRAARRQHLIGGRLSR